MTIHHNEVSSSMIKEIDYDDEEKKLTVVFIKNNSKYEYEGVDKKVYEALINADSVGKYFLANIKDKYSTNKC